MLIEISQMQRHDGLSRQSRLRAECLLCTILSLAGLAALRSVRILPPDHASVSGSRLLTTLVVAGLLTPVSPLGAVAVTDMRILCPFCCWLLLMSQSNGPKGTFDRRV